MTQKDWTAPGRAHTRRLPQRPGDPDADPTRRGDRRRLVPAALQRALRAGDVHAADAALRRALARRARDRRGRRPTARSPAARSEIVVQDRSLVLLRVCAMTGPDFRCTYRLQLNADFGFRAARETVAPVHPRPRRLAPLSLAVAAGAAGLDARLRRRRPDARLRRARRRGGAPRALRGGARGGARRDPRHRPEPHGDLGGGEPLLGRPRAAREVLRLRPCDRLVPPLLRRRRARRRPRRGSRGLRGRRTRRCSSSSRTASSTGCASTIPTGSRIRASTSSGCATAASRTSGSRRSSSRASSCATGPWRERRATSSRTTSTALFVDPRRRGADDRALRRADRRAAHVRRDRARGEARGRADDVRAGVRAAARALRRPAARGGGRRAARLPHLRRARDRRVEDDDREASAVLHDELRRVVLLEGERSPQLDEFVVALAADDRPGDGEGRRGHRVLPLLPPHRAQRGRRRPGPLLDRPGRVPRAPRSSARERHPAAAARLADARHEARRRRARAHRRARRHARASGPSAFAAGASSPAGWTTRTRSTSSGRRSSARGRSSRSVSSSTSRRRCARRSATTNWIEPNEQHEARVKAFVRSLYENREFLDDFEPFVAAR